MAQHVRVNVHRQSLRHRQTGESLLDHARTDAAATLADKQSNLVGQGHLMPMADPGFEREARLAAHRNDTILVAFAEDTDFAIPHFFEARDVERGEFGEAQAGRIEELEHRFVAHRRSIFGRNVEQAVGLIRRKNLGQGLGAFRRAHTLDRVERRFAAQPKPTVETAPGG